jgi:hypothetical protein
MTSSQVIHIYTSPTNKTTNNTNITNTTPTNNTNKNKTPDNQTNQTQAAEAAKAAKAATKAAKAANSAAAATIATKTIKTAEPIIINPTLIALEAAEEFITKMDSAFAEFESLHPQPSSSSLSHCSSHSNGNSHGNSNGNSNVNTSNVTLDSNDFDFENESQNGIDNINNVNDNVNEGHSEEDIRFDGDDFFREDDDDANVSFHANTNGFHNSEINAPIGNNACFEKSEIVQEHNADLNTYVNTNCSPMNSSSNGNNDDSDISDNMMNSITQGIQDMNHNDDTQEQEQENSIDISQEDYDCQYDCNGVDDDYNNDDDDDGWQDDSASSFTSEDFGSQHFTQTGRGGLDVVQEEDEYDEEDEDDEQFEEEEEYEEEEEEELGETSVEEVEEYQQQQDQLPEQQQQKEEVDTAWQDDNDFFTFTDEEEEEEDESLLVTPQAQQLQNSRTNLKSKSKQLTQTQEKQITIDNESSSCLNDKEKIDTIPKTQIQPQPQDPPIQPQDPPENSFSSNGHNGKYHDDYNSKNTNNSMSSNSNHNNIIHNNMNDQGDNNTLKDKEQKQESSSSLSSSITVSISSSLETNETAITPSSNITTSTPSSSQQQLQPLSSQQSSQLPPSCAKTLTYMYIDQSNTDKLAQSHAEDVLSLTLEIQNLREQLAKEQEQNGKAKIYLEQEEEKSVSLEMKMVQCKAETDMMKDEYEKEILCIREECELYKSKLSEAEQDATQALGIAKDSDEKMAQMEELLKKTLDEVEQLRTQQQQQANQLPMISEQYMEGSFDNGSYGTPRRMSNRLSTSVSSSSPYRRDKAVVTIGRNLLRQVAESDDNMSDASESTYGDGSTTSNSSYLVTLTRRSQEKRQRLRDSMNRNNEGGPTGREVVCFSSPSSQNGGLDLGYGSAFIATVKTVSKIMKHSGKKLNLGGRWFNGGKASAMKLKRKGLRSDSDDLDLESMTRNYCRSVEALVSKQRDEVKELQQFCGFLEQKLG